MAATGKIARLPPQLREQVNRRLHEGQTDQTIADWLNTLPAVQQVMKDRFAAEPVSQQNVNNWRNGEHQKWLEEEKEVARTRAFAEFSARLATEAGFNLSAGAKAIAAGAIMERLQTAAAGAELEELLALVKTANQLHVSDLDAQRVDLDERKTTLKTQELALKERQFQFRTVETFLTWFENEQARRIATSGERKETKIGELVQLFFGTMPDDIGPAPSEAGTPARSASPSEAGTPARSASPAPAP